MKKLPLIAVVLAVLIVIGGIIYYQTQTADKTVAVNEEVMTFEATLETVDRQISDGTLTIETAIATRLQIINQLDILNAAVTSAQEKKLTEAQRATFLDTIGRFNKILRDHQSTLLIIEQEVNSNAEINGVPIEGSIITSLSNTITAFEEFSNNVAQYFEETVPEDFSADGGMDEGDVLDQSAADTSPAIGDGTETP